jgi:hypothetical protein
MTKLILMTALIVVASRAHARSTDCSSSDSKLTYSNMVSDAGGGTYGLTRLTFNGETLIDVAIVGGHGIKLATMNLADHGIWQSPPTQDATHATVESVKKMTVIRVADQQTIFDDYVFCRDVTYIGPPIP